MFPTLFYLLITMFIFGPNKKRALVTLLAGHGGPVHEYPNQEMGSGVVMRRRHHEKLRQVFYKDLVCYKPTSDGEKCSDKMKGMRGRFLCLVFHENNFNQNSQTPTLSSEIRNEEKTENRLLLVEFEEKCPPGGSDSVILYTTSLRGIRKTFEDCNTIRFLLGSFRVTYDERDVSMHLEFREELWRTLGGRVVPPRLFIKGRHIGGVDEVVGFHEQGKLVDLLNGIPKCPVSGPCKGCGGMRFVLCVSCDGSRKVVLEEVGESDPPLPVRCVECNENGLVKCPVCF
ncbi:hypothetical protein L1987_10276 [Smallanthus sonchifolius]|uniref:Uncharacterized protein n=1 Tax=Smallanthus sonchifolius TaxID=185202 RepID=A0ACB9JRM7_9ASTR|nr:hypothetical protein L1987_10276 [Smallanthus sonchifolius]